MASRSQAQPQQPRHDHGHRRGRYRRAQCHLVWPRLDGPLAGRGPAVRLQRQGGRVQRPPGHERAGIRALRHRGATSHGPPGAGVSAD